MSLRWGLLAIGLAALAAEPGYAQPVADPIDALLRQQRPAPEVDPEEPDTAASSARVDAEPALPATPQRYVPPPRSTLTAPVYLHETGKAPDAPATPAEAAYDSRIRASMAAAQGFQGPMDGGWTLSAGTRELYVFQLVDRDGAVEGAWRDLRRAGALDASGLIERVDRTGSDVVFRFAGGSVATLHAAADGRWAGQLAEGGRSEAVSLRRRSP